MEQMTLDSLRAEIDAIDDQLAALFARRMDLTDRVAQVKRQSGAPVLQRGREEAILTRLEERCDPLWHPALRQLYAAIFALSRAQQREMLSEKPGEE